MRKGIALLVVALFAVTIAVPFLMEDSSAEGEVTITYDWNGGVGDIPEEERNAGVTFSLPDASNIVSPKPIAGTGYNYLFMGWSLSDVATSGVTSYIAPATDTTLYAVWTPSFEIVGYIELGGEAFDKGNISVKVLFGTDPDEPLFTYPFEEDVPVDNEGKFSVTVPAVLNSSVYEPLTGGNYYLKIHSLTADDIIGYGVGSLTDKLDTTETSNIFKIDTSGIFWAEEYGHKYPITGEIGSMKCITLFVEDEEAVGTIRGKILGNEMYKLSGAVVEVLNSRDEVITYARSNYGVYEIKDCPIGVYTLKVTALDYNSEETGIIRVRSGEVTEYDFSLTPMPKNTYLGLDLPHLLMVSGAVTAALLFLSTLFVRYRAKKNPSLLDRKDE